jgi:hypothetical protein
MSPVMNPILRGVRRLRSRSGGKKETKSQGSNRTQSELPPTLPLSATPMHSALKTTMVHQQSDIPSEEDIAAHADVIADARRGKLQKGLSSLDRKSLDSVNAVKNSIKEMRLNRQKVKSESTTTAATATTTTETTTSEKKRPPSPLLSPFPSSSTLGTEPNSASSSRRKMGSASGFAVVDDSFVSTSSSGLGEITVNDLDIGVSKRQEQQKQLQREIKAASLEKQVNKTKELIRETCTDVWRERDQLNSFQRKNWSVRKKLMQMEAPEDSLTSLNLKIEKLVRQERIWDNDIDQAKDERQTLESECADMAKAIDQMKYLLDDLHTHVVPLLSSGEPAERNPNFHCRLLDSELDDTMHSMAEERESQSDVRILSSDSA